MSYLRRKDHERWRHFEAAQHQGWADGAPRDQDAAAAGAGGRPAAPARSVTTCHTPTGLGFVFTSSRYIGINPKCFHSQLCTVCMVHYVLFTYLSNWKLYTSITHHIYLLVRD